MKKALALGLCIIMLYNLCGCTQNKGFFHLSHDYIVSALGFDIKDEEINVILESVIVNSEDTDAQKKNERLIGSGVTLQAAFEAATQKAAQPIELSHCAVAVIGETVSGERLKEICDYLYNENQITVSILLVSTPNAEKLLSSETVASVAVGYDIVSMLQTQSKLSGIDYKNRFYEIEAKRRTAVNTFALPHFKTDSKGYFINGATVFKDDRPSIWLDNASTSIFAIATDSQGKGNIIINDKQYEIESVYTVCKITGEKAPKISLEAKLDIAGGKSAKKLIEKEIKSLFSLSQTVPLDIYAIGNIIEHKRGDLFKRIKKNYEKFYKNAELEVVVK